MIAVHARQILARREGFKRKADHGRAGVRMAIQTSGSGRDKALAN